MFVYKGELYAAHSSSTAYTYSESSGLFKYDKANNRFVQMYDGMKVKGFMSVTRNTTGYTNSGPDYKYVSPAIKYHYSFEDNSRVFTAVTYGQEEIFSELMCGAKIATEDTFVAVCNGIFKSSDVQTFERVSLGEGYENYVTRDAFEQGGKYYFLASQKNGKDDFTTAVFETDKTFTQFRKVLSFQTPIFAQSFVYNEGYLYVGLGEDLYNVNDSAQYTGTLYRVDLSKWIMEDKTEATTEVVTTTTESKATNSIMTEQTTETPTTTEEVLESQEIKVGDVFDIKNMNYKVLKLENGVGTVECIGVKNKKCKTITIPATISVGGMFTK